MVRGLPVALPVVTFVTREALTVIATNNASGLPTAVKTGEAPVDGRERAEVGEEVLTRDPVPVVMTIGVEEAGRPLVATILPAMMRGEAATIGISAEAIRVGAVGAVAIPDDREDMMTARCEVRRLLQPVIVHLVEAEAVSGETASAPAPALIARVPATESPPIRQQAPAWEGARVSRLSGPIVYASRV
jgi:hypothetical protein